MKRIVLWALVVVSGCSSNEYKEGALGMRWKPPPSAKLMSETTEGDVVVGRFSGGIEVRAVAQPALPTSGDLDALKAALLAASKLSAPGQVQSAKTGTLPAGPVVRWDLRGGDDRALLYYVPAKDRYLLFCLTAAAAGFDKRGDKFELSLSSLKLQ